ncbi:MAG: DUF4834 family protein [Salibacteraceae bacterium]
MGLIRFLAIAFVIYMAFRLLTRFILPWIARQFIKKASKSMQDQMKSRTEGDKVYEEGEITIRKTKSERASTKKKDDDEYIDFEEV